MYVYYMMCNFEMHRYLFQDALRKMDLLLDNMDLKVDQRKRHPFRLVLWPRTSNIRNHLNQSRIKKKHETFYYDG